MLRKPRQARRGLNRVRPMLVRPMLCDLFWATYSGSVRNKESYPDLKETLQAGFQTIPDAISCLANSGLIIPNKPSKYEDQTVSVFPGPPYVIIVIGQKSPDQCLPKLFLFFEQDSNVYHRLGLKLAVGVLCCDFFQVV